MTGLAPMLKSILDYQYRENKTSAENSPEKMKKPVEAEKVEEVKEGTGVEKDG